MQGHRGDDQKKERKSTLGRKSSRDEIACVDFVRGVAEPGSAELTHAENFLSSWLQVAELGRHDRALDEIPGRRQALHMAKTLGRHHLAAAARPSAVRRLVASLAFQHRPLEGRRSAQRSHHWVFEVEDFVCDVRLDASQRLARLDGQITATSSSGESDADADGMTVLVLGDDKLLTSVACDVTGEFHTGGLERWPSRLELLVEDGLRIEVSLPEPGGSVGAVSGQPS